MKRAASTFLVALACMTGGQATTTAFGNYDCGEWFKKPASKTWLLGFLSGLNAGVVGGKSKDDPLGKLNSAEQAFLWMDNYCRANPLSSIDVGADELLAELIRKK